MQFDRRNFIKSLLALPGIALAKVMPPSEAKPTSMLPGISSKGGLLDRIMADTKDGGSTNKIKLKGWTIYWTGWKHSQTSIASMCQWVAVPLGKDGKWDHARHCLVVPTPGHAGIFRRGDVFNVAWHYPQLYTIDIVHLSVEECNAKLEAERRIALEAMLDLVRVDKWHDLRSGTIEQAQMLSAWEELPKRSQFYLNADRYMMTHHGFESNSWGGIKGDDRGEAMLAVHKQLFG